MIVIVFAVLLGLLVFAFGVLTLACGMVAAAIMGEIRGTDFEPHMNFLAETEKQDIEARFWRDMFRVRDTWMTSESFGYHPFNTSLWERFVDTNGLAEAANSNIRRLRLLMGIRRAALLGAVVALIGLIVSGAASRS